MKIGDITLGKRPLIAGVIVDVVSAKEVKKAIAQGADLLELRIDTFRQREAGRLKAEIIKLKNLIKSKTLPIILTIRSKREGGRYAISDKKRIELFESLIDSVELIDIELNSDIIEKVISLAKKRRKKVIVSYHNFKHTPEVKILKYKVDKARGCGADIVKIAALTKSRTDLQNLTRLVIEFNNLIVIAMGVLGTPSRVFFPILGSLVTYGSTTGVTAPGQLSLKELKGELSRCGF